MTKEIIVTNIAEIGGGISSALGNDFQRLVTELIVLRKANTKSSNGSITSHILEDITNFENKKFELMQVKTIKPWVDAEGVPKLDRITLSSLKEFTSEIEEKQLYRFANKNLPIKSSKMIINRRFVTSKTKTYDLESKDDRGELVKELNLPKSKFFKKHDVIYYSEDDMNVDLSNECIDLVKNIYGRNNTRGMKKGHIRTLGELLLLKVDKYYVSLLKNYNYSKVVTLKSKEDFIAYSADKSFDQNTLPSISMMNDSHLEEHELDLLSDIFNRQPYDMVGFLNTHNLNLLTRATIDEKKILGGIKGK